MKTLIPLFLTSAAILTLAPMAQGQNAEIKPATELAKKWATPPLTRSGKPPAIKKIKRKTTVPDNVANLFQKLEATRPPTSRGIEVVPVEVDTTSPGEPEIEVEVDVESAESFQNILFKIDSAEFYDDTSRLQVEEIAKAMVSVPEAYFLIEGHTCDLGDEEHNKSLSEKRAAKIVNELKKLGVSPERLLPMGFGETSPDVDNTDETNRQKNRRVTIYKRA